MSSPDADARPARRASCSSISARRPIASGSGSSSTSRRPSRIASVERFSLVSSSGRGEVAFVEDQIDHVQHAIEPIGKIRKRWDLVRDPRIADLRLCANDSLRQCWSRGQESASDLFRSEAAYFPQRERDLRVGTQRGVTAGEDEAKAVVLYSLFLLLRRIRRLETLENCSIGRLESRALAQTVDCLETSGRDQPRARIGGNSLFRSLLHRRRERVVQSLLGQIEIAEQTDESCEHTPRIRAI